MRLNGWQRIGIVLSILWAVGAAIYQRNADIERAAFSAGLTYKGCTAVLSEKHISDFSQCGLEFDKTFRIMLEGSWGNVAVVALLPIPFAWLLAYLAIWVLRWIRGGFKGSDGP